MTDIRRNSDCALHGLSEAVVWIAADANRERGEFVLVVSGAVEQRKSAVEACAGNIALRIAGQTSCKPRGADDRGEEKSVV